MNVTYKGHRSNSGAPIVYRVEDDVDSMDSKEFKISPFYEWGYDGRGATQLAFDILYDYTKSVSLTAELYARFATEVIQKLDEDQWRLSSIELDPFLLSAKTSDTCSPSKVPTYEILLC